MGRIECFVIFFSFLFFSFSFLLSEVMLVMDLLFHVPSYLKDPEGLSGREQELKNLKEQFHDDFPVGPLIGKCCTMDQVHLKFCDPQYQYAN